MLLYHIELNRSIEYDNVLKIHKEILLFVTMGLQKVKNMVK